MCNKEESCKKVCKKCKVPSDAMKKSLQEAKELENKFKNS